MAGTISRMGADVAPENDDLKLDAAFRKTALAAKVAKQLKEGKGFVSLRGSRPKMTMNNVILNPI